MLQTSINKNSFDENIINILKKELEHFGIENHIVGYRINPIVRFTEPVANHLLEFNVINNRKITNAEKYAKTMKNKEWQLTGETIKLTEKSLADGQNRLAAVALSKETIEMEITTKLNEKVFNILDAGKKRTLSDRLTIEGYKNGKILAPMIMMQIGYETRRNLSHSDTNEFRSLKSTTDYFSSDLEAMIYMTEKHPQLHTFAKKEYHRNLLRVPPTVIGFCKYNFSKFIYPQHVNLFFDKLFTGQNLHKEHPIAVLRDTLIRNSNAKINNKAEQFDYYYKRSITYLNGVIWKTFIKYCKNQRFKTVDFDKTKEKLYDLKLPTTFTEREIEDY